MLLVAAEVLYKTLRLIVSYFSTSKYYSDSCYDDEKKDFYNSDFFSISGVRSNSNQWLSCRGVPTLDGISHCHQVFVSQSYEHQPFEDKNIRTGKKIKNNYLCEDQRDGRWTMMMDVMDDGRDDGRWTMDNNKDKTKNETVVYLYH